MTYEEEEKFIGRITKFIFDRNLEIAALLTLNTIKPLVYIGGEFTRLILAPYVLFTVEDTEKYINFLQNRRNIDSLIEVINKKIKNKSLEREVIKEKLKKEGENSLS